MKFPTKQALREYVLSRAELFIGTVTNRFKAARVVEQMVRMRSLMEIGMRVGAGDAVFDRKRREWHVPILCAPDPRDAQGTPPTNVGTAVVDSHLNWVFFPTRDEVRAILEKANSGIYSQPLGDWVMKKIKEKKSRDQDLG